MNWENSTLCKLALASYMYDSLFGFNESLACLNKNAGGSIDLSNTAHRDSLLEWLNDWGCRHLPEAQHQVASRSILAWHQKNGASLFPNKKPLWKLSNRELNATANAYGCLRGSTGAWRDRGGRRLEVHIGATAASKILFVIRPEALMPWDEAIRTRFKYDGSATSCFEYLKTMRNLISHIGMLCRNRGFQIDDLPKELGRANSTVLALVNEYVWITVTKECELPSSRTLARWAKLG